MEVNKIYNENCLDTMKRMPDSYVDLTVTSPPYDDMIEYEGAPTSFNFKIFKKIAKQLFRVSNCSPITYKNLQNNAK